MKRLSFFLFVGLAFVISACGSDENQQNQSVSAGEDSEQAMSISLTQAWATDTTELITPECATYDPDREVFYVSNLNRDNEAENDGYISLVNADGSIKEARWVEGLRSPLGNDFYGDYLYVSDANRIVKIDIESGSIEETINVEGASDLNGMDIDEDGTIYVADTEGNKVFQVSQEGEVTTLSDDEQLNNPNGVYFNGDELLVASFGGNKLLALNLEDNTLSTTAEGVGQADGIVPLEEGQYLISSWRGEIFLVSNDGQSQKILDTQEQEVNAADIGYISEENLLVVPTFFDNRLVAYTIE